MNHINSDFRISCLLFSTGRAASTGIYHYLDTAAQLNLPRNKEPHHWCNITNYEGIYDLIKNIYIAKNEDYYAIYSASKIGIDASCGYFFYLDDVLGNLGSEGRKIKSIFLYREPVSRAASWFNERKKKGLTEATNILEDMTIAQSKEQGLWWEHYYDNVLYDSNFRKLSDYFDEVIAINYDCFASSQRVVIAQIASYLKVDLISLENLNLTPVNSSREAVAMILLREHAILRLLAGSLSLGIKRWIWRQYLGASNIWLRSQHVNNGHRLRKRIASMLPISTEEYRRFREHIGYQDIYYSKPDKKVFVKKPQVFPF